MDSQDIELGVVSQAYLDCLKNEQGRSDGTVRTYRSWLEVFERWLTSEGLPATLGSFNVSVLKSFLLVQRTRAVNAMTVRSVFCPLRGLGDYLVKQGYMEANPTDAIELPKKVAPHVNRVSESEMKLLLDAIESQPGRRSLVKAIFYTMAFTDISCRELFDMRVSDVNLAERSITIRGKDGSKTQTLRPGQNVMEAVGRWLMDREEVRSNLPWLWTYTPRRRLGEKALHEFLNALKLHAGLEESDHIQTSSLGLRSRVSDPPLESALSAMPSEQKPPGDSYQPNRLTDNREDGTDTFGNQNIAEVPDAAAIEVTHGAPPKPMPPDEDKQEAEVVNAEPRNNQAKREASSVEYITSKDGGIELTVTIRLKLPPQHRKGDSSRPTRQPSA